MPVATQLLAFGLRQVIDVPPDLVENLVGMAVDVAASAGTAGKVFALVRQRLTDHGETLPKALAAANDRAWQAVAVALAGRASSRRSRSSSPAAHAEGASRTGGSVPVAERHSFPNTTEDFRQACLSELRRARKGGLLVGGPADPDGTARQAAAYRELGRPAGPRRRGQAGGRRGRRRPAGRLRQPGAPAQGDDARRGKRRCWWPRSRSSSSGKSQRNRSCSRPGLHGVAATVGPAGEAFAEVGQGLADMTRS